MLSHHGQKSPIIEGSNFILISFSPAYTDVVHYSLSSPNHVLRCKIQRLLITIRIFDDTPSLTNFDNDDLNYFTSCPIKY
jgi:hypothetical protein